MSFSHHCYDYSRDSSVLFSRSLVWIGSFDFVTTKCGRYMLLCGCCFILFLFDGANPQIPGISILARKRERTSLCVCVCWCRQRQLDPSNVAYITKAFVYSIRFARINVSVWASAVQRTFLCNIVMWSCGNKWQKDCYRQKQWAPNPHITYVLSLLCVFFLLFLSTLLFKMEKALWMLPANRNTTSPTYHTQNE